MNRWIRFALVCLIGLVIVAGLRAAPLSPFPNLAPMGAVNLEGSSP